MKKLAASYPLLEAFRSISPLLDLAVWGERLQGRQNNSLRSLAERCFGRGLDKAEQMSDWERRPLSEVRPLYPIPSTDDPLPPIPYPIPPSPTIYLPASYPQPPKTAMGT